MLAVLLAVLILLVIFLVPAYISSDSGRKIILAKINNALDGQADFTDLSMSWRKGLTITDFRFKDNNNHIAITAKQISTKPHYGSILTGSLSFGRTIIDKPTVEINLKNKSAKKSKAPPQKASLLKAAQPVVLPIRKIDLVINDGNLKVTDRRTQTVELSEINSAINLRPPGQQTDFDLNTQVAGNDKGSQVRVQGRIKPRRRLGWSLAGTTGDLTVEVNDLDLASLGPMFALAGIDIEAKGRISADIKSEIKDGRLKNLLADVKGKNLEITAALLKGDRLKTNSLDIYAKLATEPGLINIDKLQIQTDWFTAQATGDVPTTFESLAKFITAESKRDFKGSLDCDVVELARQIPHTLGLKEGMQVTSGRLTANIEKLAEAGQGKIVGQAELAGLAGIVDAKAVSLSEPVKIQGRITSTKSVINFDKLNASTSFCNVTATGSSKLLNLDAEVDLAKLQAELGQFVDTGQYRLAGRILGKAQISPGKNKISVVGTSTVKDLRISSAARGQAFEPAAEITFAFDLPKEKDVVNIDSVEATASFGRLNIKKAVLPLNKESPKFMSLPISASFDLQKLVPFMVLFVSFPREMQLAGTAESEVSVSLKNGTYTIATDATTIRNLKLTSPGRQPFIQDQVRFVFDGDYNPAQANWLVRKLMLTSPAIKIKGYFQKNVKGDQSKLQGRADLEYDWSSVTAIASPFLPPGLKLAGKRKDSINFTSQYPVGQNDKVLANLNTKGKFGFEQARYMGLDFGPTNINVQVQQGLLKIAPFSTTVNNGQLTFAAQVDFNQKPTLLTASQPIKITNVQITPQTAEKLLMYLNPIFANAANVSGIANLDCQRLAIPLAEGREKDIDVAGTISAKFRLQGSGLLAQILSVVGVNTRGRDITIHPTEFVLRNGFLRYDDMRMDVGEYPLNFKGKIGLNKSLNMTVTLPYTIGGRTVKTPEAADRISLPLTGTIDNPELDLGKLLEEQLKKELERQLRKGLEELFK